MNDTALLLFTCQQLSTKEIYLSISSSSSLNIHTQFNSCKNIIKVGRNKVKLLFNIFRKPLKNKEKKSYEELFSLLLDE